MRGQSVGPDPTLASRQTDAVLPTGAGWLEPAGALAPLTMISGLARSALQTASVRVHRSPFTVPSDPMAVHGLEIQFVPLLP